MNFDVKISLNHLPFLGWLPIITDGDGHETYRGEYHHDPQESYEYAIKRLATDNPSDTAQRKLGITS